LKLEAQVTHANPEGTEKRYYDLKKPLLAGNSARESEEGINTKKTTRGRGDGNLAGVPLEEPLISFDYNPGAGRQKAERENGR